MVRPRWIPGIIKCNGWDKAQRPYETITTGIVIRSCWDFFLPSLISEMPTNALPNAYHEHFYSSMMCAIGVSTTTFVESSKAAIAIVAFDADAFKCCKTAVEMQLPDDVLFVEFLTKLILGMNSNLSHLLDKQEPHYVRWVLFPLLIP